MSERSTILLKIIIITIIVVVIVIIVEYFHAQKLITYHQIFLEQ